MKVSLQKMSPDGPDRTEIAIYFVGVFLLGLWVGARFF